MQVTPSHEFVHGSFAPFAYVLQPALENQLGPFVPRYRSTNAARSTGSRFAPVATGMETCAMASTAASTSTRVRLTNNCRSERCDRGLGQLWDGSPTRECSRHLKPKMSCCQWMAHTDTWVHGGVADKTGGLAAASDTFQSLRCPRSQQCIQITRQVFIRCQPRPMEDSQSSLASECLHAVGATTGGLKQPWF